MGSMGAHGATNDQMCRLEQRIVFRKIKKSRQPTDNDTLVVGVRGLPAAAADKCLFVDRETIADRASSLVDHSTLVEPAPLSQRLLQVSILPGCVCQHSGVCDDQFVSHRVFICAFVGPPYPSTALFR